MSSNCNNWAFFPICPATPVKWVNVLKGNAASPRIKYVACAAGLLSALLALLLSARTGVITTTALSHGLRLVACVFNPYPIDEASIALILGLWPLTWSDCQARRHGLPFLVNEESPVLAEGAAHLSSGDESRRSRRPGMRAALDKPGASE